MFSGRKNKSIPLMLIIPLIFVFLNVRLAAQDSEEGANHSHNSLVKGSKSFQFRISQNLTLSSFEGTMISAKKHYSAKSALRMGLGLDIGAGNWDQGNQEADFTNFQIDLTIQYLYYPAPLSSVNFYLGTGPIVQYNRSKDDVKYEDGTDAGYRIQRLWALGMLGSWGVEWFADENISFICEYGAGIKYSSTKYENYLNPSPMINNRNEFSFFSQSVDFGLSVYF